MPKYLLFCFDYYYPCGGLSDYVGEFDSIESAKKEIETNRKDYNFYQIVDHATMLVEDSGDIQKLLEVNLIENLI